MPATGREGGRRDLSVGKKKKEKINEFSGGGIGTKGGYSEPGRKKGAIP